MPASPALPAADDDAATTPPRKSNDRLRTGLLLGGLLLFMGVLRLPTAMSLHDFTCNLYPEDCDEGLIALANFLGGPALLVIFGVSIVVSIVLLALHRRAFYVPLVGAVGMIACVAVWFPLVNAGLG